MVNNFYSARHLEEMKCDLLHKYRKCITFLSQDDFEHGTYRITNPGIYKLTQDIVFDPESDNDYIPQQDYSTPPYILGFFAAITIECKDVVIDLDGHIIKQSLGHNIQQRFYAHIELCSAPFMPGQGPGNFGSTIRCAKRCVIMNGTLGRSSHHGIHGNTPEMVLIQDLKINTFEVAGIAINGCDSLRIERCKIGPVNMKVPVLGTYSAARFAVQFAKKLPLLKLNYDEQKLLAELTTNLENRTREMFNSIIANYDTGNWDKDPIFYNKFSIPDGNMYGILIHPPGVAINELVSKDVMNPFVVEETDSEGDNTEGKKIVQKELKRPYDIIVHSVYITEIVGRVDEIPGLSLEDGKLVQLDVSGSVYQIDNQYFITTNGKYIPNDLTKLQLYLAELSIKYNFHLGKNSINSHLIDWSKSNKSIKEFFFYPGSKYKYKLDGDDMFHINKGIFGIRADGIRKLRIYNSKIKNIENIGRLGNTVLGGEYKLSHDAQRIPGYHGADTTGINLSYSDDVKMCRLVIKSIKSSNGESRGVRLINDCSSVEMKLMNINTIYAGNLINGKYTGEDYYGVSVDYSHKYPNLLPNAVGIKESDHVKDFKIYLSSINIKNLLSPGCSIPIWLQSE